MIVIITDETNKAQYTYSGKDKAEALSVAAGDTLDYAGGPIGIVDTAHETYYDNNPEAYCKVVEGIFAADNWQVEYK